MNERQVSETRLEPLNDGVVGGTAGPSKSDRDGSIPKAGLLFACPGTTTLRTCTFASTGFEVIAKSFD